MHLTRFLNRPPTPDPWPLIFGSIFTEFSYNERGRGAAPARPAARVARLAGPFIFHRLAGARRRLKWFLRLALSGYLQTPTTQVALFIRFVLTVRRGEVH